MEVYSHVLELLDGFRLHLCPQSYLVKHKQPNYLSLSMLIIVSNLSKSNYWEGLGLKMQCWERVESTRTQQLWQ